MLKKITKYLLKLISNLFNLSIFIKKNTENSKYDLIDKNIWIPFLTQKNIFLYTKKD